MRNMRTEHIPRGVWLAGLVCSATAFLLVCSITDDPAIADTLGTTGTFEGVYHRDRWGVGHFGYFIVHPGLHAKLAEYEGKRIRLTVTKGSQPTNPGPAIMLEIGEIAILEEPPLRISLGTIPEKLAPEVPFQVVCRLSNVTQGPLKLLGSDAVISVNSVPKVTDPEQPAWLLKDYKQGQMACPVHHLQLTAPVRTFDGPPTNLGSRRPHSAPCG